MLKVATNETVVRVIAQAAWRSGMARRFIAGETFTEAEAVVRDLNQIGIPSTLDLLGEGVRQESEAEQAAEAYSGLLRSIHSSQLNSTISVKLTQLGLDISRTVCIRNIRRILQEAEKLNNFVRIDMEGSRHTQATLDIFFEQVALFGVERVGVVIQSYLYRSGQDVAALAAQQCNVRVCKGAYMEPPEIAFPGKQEVDDNFIRLVEVLLNSAGHVAVATHDDRMIEATLDRVKRLGIPRDRYEFQMLYGVRRERQLQLCRQGERVKVYVPFGTQWAPYFMRRLAERPANVLFMMRHLFRR